VDGSRASEDQRVRAVTGAHDGNMCRMDWSTLVAVVVGGALTPAGGLIGSWPGNDGPSPVRSVPRLERQVEVPKTR
jgi:hypothetical protein